jgi:hypothetical protein
MTPARFMRALSISCLICTANLFAASQDWGQKLTCHYQVETEAKGATLPFKFSLAYGPQTLAAFHDKMEKGVRLTIVHRALMQDNVIGIFGCQVYFDLWEEEYYVQHIDNNSWREESPRAKQQVIRTKHKDDAINLCFTTQFNLIVPFSQVRVQTLVDPTNKEQMERTRRWLAQRGIGGNSSIIGKALGSLIRLDHQTEFETICTALPSPKA